MNSIFYADEFKRRVKPLSKKYHTLKTSIDLLIENLIADPFIGKPLGDNIYKIRLGDDSRNKGTRGGFRVIYYLIIPNEDETKIVLTTIYSKSEYDTIDKKALQQIIKNL